MAVPLDEFPVHQVPLSMAHVASSDRNAYDRSYFNAHDRTGDVFFVSGMGVYPNLGVTDAFATLRRGDEQVTVRASDALGDDRMRQEVGPFRIEVLEPLERIRLVCEGGSHGLEFDLVWQGSFPVIDEPSHVIRQAGQRDPRCRSPRAGWHVERNLARGRRRDRADFRSLARDRATVHGVSGRWVSRSLRAARRQSPIPCSASGGLTFHCVSRSSRSWSSSKRTATALVR